MENERESESKDGSAMRFIHLKEANPEAVEQRSPEWYAQRDRFSKALGLTSSKYGSLLFIKTHDDFLHKWEVCFNGQKEVFDESAKMAMNHGVEHEQTAIDCFLEKFPHMWIVDAPFTICSNIEGFAASPDGFYYNEKTQEVGCIEVKCPWAKGKKKKNKKVTYYYVGQMHLHMVSTQHEKGGCIFISWGIDGLAAWHVDFCPHTWNAIKRISKSFREKNYEQFLNDREHFEECCHAVAKKARPY